ncbi:MAG TPA: hypothetical protein VN132_12845 [Bdellovibrio sp.]|nr:hypothetical protein [Bdellovibrio sp.]
MKKIVLAISAMTIFASGSAFANNYGKFTGKCAKQALNAAVSFWANVPNPSEELEYQPVSAIPAKAGSNVYNVVLGFGAQGEFLGTTTYQVTFADYSNCAQPAVVVLPAK